MAINYTIHADVVDIRNDNPQQGDVFFVDTNVWYWLTYSKVSQGASLPYQTRDYPNYIRKSRRSKATLRWCGLSLSELAHNIERTERDIFIKANGDISTKMYRHNMTSERQRVVTEITSAWGLVKQFGSPLDVNIDNNLVCNALNCFQNQCLDGYDVFMIEATKKAGIINVITDDGDFVTIPNIVIYTANNNVIEMAKAQGKLIVRTQQLKEAT